MTSLSQQLVETCCHSRADSSVLCLDLEKPVSAQSMTSQTPMVAGQ